MGRSVRIRGLALAAALTILAVGCSSGGASVAPSVAPPATSEASPEIAPSGSAAVGDGSLARVKDAGNLRVGVSAGFRPFEFVEGDKIVGMDPDLTALIAEELGVAYEITDSEFSGIIPSLYADKFDVIISAITATPARAEKVLFSQPYGEATMQFLVKADRADLNTAADLEGKIVAGQVGASSQSAIEAWQEAGHDFQETVFFNSFPEATVALADGRVDAVAGILPAVNVFTSENEGFKSFEAFGPKLYMGIPFRFEDVDLCVAVNDILTKAKADGRLAAIQKEWLGFEMPTPETYPDAVVKHC